MQPIHAGGSKEDCESYRDLRTAVSPHNSLTVTMYVPMGVPRCVLPPQVNDTGSLTTDGDPPKGDVVDDTGDQKSANASAGHASRPVTAEEAVLAVEYSPAGQLLAECSARAVRLWSTQPLTLLSTYVRSHADVARNGANKHLAWKRDGSRLAIGTERGHLLFVHVVPPEEDEESSRTRPGQARVGRAHVPVSARSGQDVAGVRWSAPAFKLRPAESPGQASTATMSHTVRAVLARDTEVMVATTAGVLERVPWDATYFDAAAAIVLPQ